MELLKQLVAKDMEMVQGRIMNIGEDGKLLVKTDSGGTKIICDFLRTSAGLLPPLFLGTPVLCIADHARGYVLGVVQPYHAHEPEKANPPSLKLHAEDRIELTCGESKLSMNKEGNIVLRGANITTRASARNKIKGATVSIN